MVWVVTALRVASGTLEEVLVIHHTERTGGAMISIRRIAVDDWQGWRRLRREALREAPQAFGSSLASWTGDGDTEERWRNRLRDVPVNVVADVDGVDVGMCCLTAVVDGEAELIAMWVAPEARGRGVGAALVRAVVDQAREAGATRVLLDVVQENESAVALYSTCGFVDVEFAAGPTRNLADRRMRLDLG